MKTNSLFKRLVSMLIVVLMICTLFPVTALADDDPPQQPSELSYEILKDLLKVEIECKTHDDEDYPLEEGRYTITGPTLIDGEWKCSVTVDSNYYIGLYNTLTGQTHTLKKAETVTLVYKSKDGVWKCVRSDDDIDLDVVCNGIPTPPEKPTTKYLEEELLANGAVTIDCTNSYAVGHADRTYGLLAGSYNVSEPTLSGDKYTCTVTVDSTKYIEQYNSTNIDAAHSLANGESASKTITLKHNGTGWVVDSTIPVVFTVDCNTPAPAPQQPSEEYLERLLANGAVKIDCNNTKASHEDKTYGLISGTYKIGNVSGNAASGYTCAITVTNPTPYVNKYITDMSGVNHTLDPNTQTPATITLKHNGNSWQIDGEPATFTVKCVTPDPINWETGLSVQKVATNTTSGTVVNTVAPGEKITYTITVENKTGTALTNIKVSEPLDLINLDCLEVSPAGQYSMEDGVGVWTIPSLENGAKTTLTIKVQVKDKVPDKTEIKNIATIIAATAGNDSLPGNIRPTGSSDVKVSAPEEPKVPDAPSYDELKGLLNVTINCINNISHDHKTKTYPLLEGSYMISGVEGDAYTYIVTVDSAEYIAQYTTDTAKKHSLADAQGSKTINLKYSNNRWNVDVPAELAAGDDAEKVSAFPVTFNVVCEETPVTTYTVTYKDGVGGKVFKDDVHTVKSGATTPAFVGGIPTRPGYVFVGWTPAVSRCVTGNATYTATWRKVKDTTVIEIGGGNSSSSSSKEENPNTGAPVFVGVSVGALAAAK